MRKVYLKNFENNMRFITSYYKKLTTYTKQNKSVGSVNEWIVDNFYILSEQEQTVKQELYSIKILSIKLKRKEYLNDLVNAFLKKEDYHLNTELFYQYFNDYQVKNDDFLTYDEIDYIYTSLKTNVIDKLKELTEVVWHKFLEREKIENKFKKIDYLISKNKAFDIYDYLKIDKSILKNYFYILEINYRINSLGSLTEEVFKKLNELLDNNNMSLKDVVKKEQDERTSENMLMVNLFSSFKVSIRIKLEDLYAQISYTEKALMEEEANIYDNMYEVSKLEYRRQIKLLVKKNRKNKEYSFVKNIIERANKDKKHVGFYLFKEKNSDQRAILYIAAIVTLSILLSYLFAYYIGNISFFILLIPMTGFVIDVLTQLLIRRVDTRTLLRLKFENKLPEEYSTMVVIPTLIKDAVKVKDMFEKLELYYLSNRSKNLYFCLLGDVITSSTKSLPVDDKIVRAGIEKTAELNRKYNTNVFHFVYRNRFYNNGEGAYLGYERKRGALNHFNKLLLGLMTKADQEKYFKYHTFNDFKTKIKYVITLDADTKLLLNTALKLIGTMAHPFNKPVLNKEKTMVIKGHAIMQPRISIDVEVTNKSEYSQLFAGLGGLDIYSTKQFDLYQDLFGEGSFTGKGIYDLAVFNQVLSETFPENLILSHDLIEGNYLRCGYISDIELFDDFPSKYLNDAMRHHRWTRGDWQIIAWLKNKVLNANGDVVKNPINIISKWKIFDNLRRSLMAPSLLALIIYGFTFSKVGPGITLAIVTSIIAIPIFFYVLTKLIYRQKYDVLLRYYLNLIYGFLAVVNRSLFTLAVLPYESYLYLNAIAKSLYRMYVTKKNLLNWITSEEVEATSKNTIANYISNFKINYFFAILIVYVAYIHTIEYLYLAVALGVVFVLAPILLQFISRDMVEEKLERDNKDDNNIRRLAASTWKFFDTFLNKEYNYLIPDNYQLNRDVRVDYRTSPTDIGFSLVAIVSAYELKLINEDKAIDKINHVLKNVELLKKWHGHLYNWYSIKDYKELQPLFVSTADSGNFVSSLYVVKGFLDKFNKYTSLRYRVNKMINDTDFSKLYNQDIDVFSIGYSVNDGVLVPYNYNNFLSEARLASFIAIAKGDVPFKHWFRLDKTLTKYKWYKGVVSWTGTMFEYYMPLIFMKSFKHTLLDETYLFAYYAHKEFVREADPKLPWGITESAYNELDDSQNYKYKAFGIPYLKFHDSEVPSLVIAPYGSIMALARYPKDVIENINKFQKLGMEGEFGLYESYDHDDHAIVKSYYSHHQGMILSSITNYLKNDIIQEHFHNDKNIKSIEILLKEKVQVRAYINLQIAKYKKYNYARDVYDSDIREQEGIMPMPEVGVLSNGMYSTFINDRGLGFSKYKNLYINRYRKVTKENYGLFLYIKDLTNNKLWTNTYYPICSKPEKYHVVFASDRIKYVREDNEVITTTEITVTKDHNAEIRKITIENSSDADIDFELTSYSEVILARLEEDIAHQAFNSVTINSDYDPLTSSLIFTRSSRTKVNTKYFVINRFLGDEHINDEFETSRLDFLGRNNTTANPDKVINSIPLSSNIDNLLDPIMSIRKKVTISSNTKKTYYLIVGFGKSKEQVLEIVNTYKDKKSIETAFATATVLNNTRNRYANLSGRELRSYNTMLKYVYQTIPTTDSRKEILRANTLTQASMWKFGVSGDLPIILVNIEKAEDSAFLKEVLQAYEFYKSRAIYVDVVIMNNDLEKADYIDKYVNSLKYRINNLNYFENSPGNIYVVKNLTSDETTLFKTIAKIYFDTGLRRSLDDQIYDLNTQKLLMLDNYNNNLDIIKPNIDTELTNAFGGFASDGKEYIITDVNTPKPWSNILANETFGTIITNNFGGFTYARNSREFKLTSWSNDAVSDSPSEAIYINEKRIIPSYVKHGFGYSTFVVNTNDFDLNIDVFVPTNDSIKVYDLNFTNKNKEISEYNLRFSFKPVLGVTPEQTNRHILTEFDSNNNMVVMRNVYNPTFKNEKVFVTSTNPIIECDIDTVATKSISVKLDLNTNSRMAFMIGCGMDIERNTYVNLDHITNSLNQTKEYWINLLSVLQVETGDSSFDYMINGWYLYQVYASRLYSKAAFYQVGGATGFRDQLQDSMSLLYSNPNYTKNQILKHAKHQFIEGDVLHWWHEELMFGARTRFTDDYLWLVYVTYEYIKVTGDSNILNEQVSFVSGDLLFDHEHERGVPYTYTATTETLSYHLKLAIEKTLKQFGKHQLPLMGSGDWNDGMNKVGEKGIGESVWMGFFLYDLLIKMAKISDEMKDLCLGKAAILKEALNKDGWDGKWYLRAYFDDSTILGSINSSECKIDLISQAWSIITDIADSKKIASIIKEVDHRLVDTKAGIIKLLDPAFTGKGPNPGYIKEYLPGIRENGAQYTHAAMWYIMALVKAGETAKAYQYYQMINPANKDITTYKVEPYVIAADIYSNPNFSGQGGWTWYTGSASWAYKIGIEELIGFKKVGNTLVIKPTFTWDKIKVKYKFNNTNYNLTIYKDASEEIITLIDDNKEHNIVVGGSNDIV